jgi:hypothetical protein
LSGANNLADAALAVRAFFSASTNMHTRRNFLLSLPALLSAAPATLAGYRLTRSDDEFLDDLCRRSFRFFVEHSDARTGLTLDRARTDGSTHDETHRNTASAASTGFHLTALCIAAERGWMKRAEAQERTLNCLRFLSERAPREHGWFYHWMDWRNGERTWRSELSSIDTALLFGGVLTARQYFAVNKEIPQLAAQLYHAIDFEWMLNGHARLLSHGWYPERGFIANRWDTYSEHPLLYLLAIGSPTHAIPPRAWYSWRRSWIEYKRMRYMGKATPLFTHQYSHAWIDFRGRRENRLPYVDYFQNSVMATRVHRQFCLDLAQEFPGYSENIWGITASDSAKGYVAWSGPPRHAKIDGSVVPCAAGGSLMFAPDICLPALKAMKEKFGEKVYGKYGFVDAFNPNNGWINPDVIGIDVGITLLSAENLRSGKVWRWFMRNREITRALRLAGIV